jgi:hypothetical protein
MKFLTKLVAFGLVGGVAVSTLYGAPGGYSDQAAAIKSKMVEDHRYVLTLKAEAIKEKDIIRLNCINDKLVVMLPQMNIADSLLVQIDGSESAEQTTLYNDLQLAANAVREQREQAAGCANISLIVTESSNLYQGVDVPTPTDPEPEPGQYVEPPGYASPDR